MFLDFFNNLTDASIITTGKTEAKSIPFFKSSPNADDIMPTRYGPDEHPASPASARNAKTDVEHTGILTAARLYVPGHITPTANPHTPTPISDSTAEGENAIIIYPARHSAEQSIIYLVSSTFLLRRE